MYIKISKSNRGGRVHCSLGEVGFTLIELLVVIAIISLLSSVVLATLVDAKKKAEITKFRETARSFVNAMELYKSSNNGKPYDNMVPGYYGAATYALRVGPYLGHWGDVEKKFNDTMKPYIDFEKIKFSFISYFWYGTIFDSQYYCGENADDDYFLYYSYYQDNPYAKYLNSLPALKFKNGNKVSFLNYTNWKTYYYGCFSLNDK